MNWEAFCVATFVILYMTFVTLRGEPPPEPRHRKRTLQGDRDE